MRKVCRDSRARDAKPSGYRRRCILWDIPSDGIGGKRAAGRTIPKVKKADTKQTVHDQPLDATHHARRVHYSLSVTLSDSDQISGMIYGKTK